MPSNSSSAKSDYDGPRPGDMIAGKYRVENVIGAGGMGVVLSARHVDLNQRVAMKFLRGKPHAELVGRFMREARAAASLSGEHVVRVMDVDRLPTGEPYMVMEFLTGRNLSKVIRSYQGNPMPVTEVLDYLLQAMAGVAEAHRVGIVHRDLKPGNLFETTRSDGSRLIKVLDFGISKITDESGIDEQTLTATNMILGSPQYASPEQLRSVKSVDARSDLWSMGVILYYMLAGKRPFEADNLSALCLKIATDEPTPLMTLRPDAPAALIGLVDQCLQKDREKRIQSSDALIAGLKQINDALNAASRASASALPTHGEIPTGPSGNSNQSASAPIDGSGLSGALPPASAMVPASAALVPAGVDVHARTSFGTTDGSGQANVPRRIVLSPGQEVITATGQAAWATQGATNNSKTVAMSLGALALAGAVVGGLFYMREPTTPDYGIGDVQAVTPPPKSTSTAKATGPTTVDDARPGRVIKKTEDPDEIEPPPVGGDTPQPMLMKGLVVAKRNIQILSSAGAGSVVATVKKKDLVFVLKDKGGEWLFVSYTGNMAPVQGYVPREAVEPGR